MAGSIIDTVMSFLGQQGSGPIATQMGESPGTIQRGLQGAAAAMLAALVSKADDRGFLSQIFGMITSPANTSAVLSAGAVTGPSPLSDLGGRFLTSIFGTQLGSVTDAVSQFSGFSASKAGTLLSMAAPLVLGGLGKYVRENNVSAGDLGSQLKSEAPSLQRFLPAGFWNGSAGVPSALGTVPAQDAAMTNKWLWPVVLLAALLLAGLWFFNRSNTSMKEAGSAVGDAASSTMSALGEFFKTKLPNGVELNIPKFGIENKLLAFLQDPSTPVDDSTWFNFGRLLFDTGEATLQPSSEEELNNIARY